MAKLPRATLKNLVIDELSGVDKPCQAPATVAIMKRVDKAVRSANADHFRETGDSWRYRVRPPAQFDQKTFRTVPLGKDTGVKSVMGKTTSDGSMHIQALIFDKDKFPKQSDAAKWIDDNPDVLRKPHDKRAIAKVIRKQPNGKYGLYTHDGKKLLSEHDTKEGAEAQERAIEAAKHDKRAIVFKQAVLTSEEDGHQHVLDLDDATEQDDDDLCTSGAYDAEGRYHAHQWVFDPETGAISIAANDGHAHETDAKLSPTDLARAQMLDEAADEQESAIPEPMEDVPSDGIPAPVTDEKSSGAVISVAIAARAHETNSTRSPAAKQAGHKNKEPTMEPIVLPDSHFAHYKKLSGDEAAAFLKRSHAERDAVVKAALEAALAADPVVYKRADGLEIRKSAGDAMIAMAKQNDEMAAALTKMASEKESAEIAKRAAETLPHYGETRAYILKAVEKGGGDAAMVEKALAALKTGNAALDRLTKFTDHRLAKGFELPANDIGPAKTETAGDKLRKRVEKFQADNKIPTYEAAYTRALASDPEARELYAQATSTTVTGIDHDDDGAIA